MKDSMTQGHTGDVAKNVDCATGYNSKGCWELQTIRKPCTGTLKALIVQSYIWVTITDFTKSAKDAFQMQSLFRAGGTINIREGFRTYLELVTTGRFRYLTVWTFSDVGKNPICLVKYMDKMRFFLKSLKMLMKTDINNNSHE